MSGTKQLIEDYVQTVCESLDKICDNDWGAEFGLQEKFEFFFETRQAFGRSALCLSGGATLGMYHLGVLKTLHENNLLPRVISGSSVGSIMASIVGTFTFLSGQFAKYHFSR
jgi:TAG lipase / steryl ester hydrolase / phospholipase A2 / LPA acyltransferase